MPITCRNRHCPKCQGAAARAWLTERQDELLPVPYYHLVFTLPTAVADIAYHNKATVYDLLFKASSETLMTIAADPKHLGARVGAISVLHTWGSALTHHPHVHMIAPGGGFSLDGLRWVACRPGFFLPVRVLSRLFRRLFLEKLMTAFDAGELRFFKRVDDITTMASFKSRINLLLDEIDRLSTLRHDVIHGAIFEEENSTSIILATLLQPPKKQ